MNKSVATAKPMMIKKDSTNLVIGNRLRQRACCESDCFAIGMDVLSSDSQIDVRSNS